MVYPITDTTYMYPQYSAPVYGVNPAMNAAQRWNAMNCSYLNDPTVTSPGNSVQPVNSIASISGPRFPMRSKSIISVLNNKCIQIPYLTELLILFIRAPKLKIVVVPLISQNLVAEKNNGVPN